MALKSSKANNSVMLSGLDNLKKESVIESKKPAVTEVPAVIEEEQFTAKVLVSLTPSRKVALKEFSKRKCMTISEVMRQALNEYMENH